MMSRILFITMTGSVLALTSGCLLFVAGAAASAGVGTYAYVSGELRSSEAVKLDKSWAAAQAAMNV